MVAMAIFEDVAAADHKMLKHFLQNFLQNSQLKKICGN
jgi:hypothetical protein